MSTSSSSEESRFMTLAGEPEGSCGDCEDWTGFMMAKSMLERRARFVDPGTTISSSEDSSGSGGAGCAFVNVSP
jgi:hypothetical protein